MSLKNPWNELSSINLGYVLEQYDLYKEDVTIVEPSYREMFDQWGAPTIPAHSVVSIEEQGDSTHLVLHKMKNLAATVELANNIRKYGHLEANIYPLEEQTPLSMLQMSTYGLTEEDIKEIPASFVCSQHANQFANALEAIHHLKKTYCASISFELDHVQPEMRQWLLDKIESKQSLARLTNEDKQRLFTLLCKAEGFEQFLQKMFTGQKRFSVEGLESLVPVMNELIELAAAEQVDDVMISMAHRGRLNVLTHVLDKPYEAMFAQFKHAAWVNEDPSLELTEGSTGDVKYHLGATKTKEVNGHTIRVSLGNNPSHLEFAGAVMEGCTRAAQDDRTNVGYPEQHEDKALPILVHGDAAFTGQGVVTEILNFANTNAYSTGGTVHIIANNCIGFTTESEDDRSTHYPSDVVKGYEMPIIHVNADDPEACIQAATLAFQYRTQFQRDILINLIGYRRMGHNEMDEPRATSPLMYNKVDQHPTITRVYKQQLLETGALSEQMMDHLEAMVNDLFQQAFDSLSDDKEEVQTIEERVYQGKDSMPDVETAISKEALLALNKDLVKWPEGFNVFGKLKKILTRRIDAMDNHKKIDWGHAEALAYASILKDGTPIRLTGQDSERGTFSHRNLVLSDYITGEKYSPMHHLQGGKASFAIHNSTLTEMAVLGFEYGYSVCSPETLVMWEAQFGDFANGAQVMFDQFISAGKEKWGQQSGIVMLLPHGYEGQGPEHSSGRLERYLQLCAENNWTVANISSTANYFHLLRKQAALLGTEHIRPLVIMTPKSLLRNPSASAYIEQFTNGKFEPVIEQPGLGHQRDKVKRVVFTSGRLAVELGDQIAHDDTNDWLDIIRIEQLYPFPEKRVKDILGKYTNLQEIMWVQEEPQNMGAWTYIAPLLHHASPKEIKVQYVGRPPMASPSEGNPIVHKREQERIIHQALTQLDVTQYAAYK
ncbi:2-oxoglutarate dehydrogenase E1 component [Pontibacillus litoralis]|nr:2-oxoglutarate dehydrogenase E1 component [Pontibacillus litoralis]